VNGIRGDPGILGSLCSAELRAGCHEDDSFVWIQVRVPRPRKNNRKDLDPNCMTVISSKRVEPG